MVSQYVATTRTELQDEKYRYGAIDEIMRHEGMIDDACFS
jgi:hypothetical protein